MKLEIATCQFPVSSDVRANTRSVLAQMRTAKKRDAAVVHFCEGALTGYAGADFESHDGMDWQGVEEGCERVAELARELGLWVLLGSSHRLGARHKPHNSVYVIDDRGKLVDRYDKRFCAGDPTGHQGDLAHYSPGDHFSVFSIRGLRCGIAICHDYRYPELYREYKQRGVELMFHSYHAANVRPATLRFMQRQVGKKNRRFNHGTTLPEITMPATMQAAAASSHVWISCSNSSARESCWPAFFVRADGVITGRLRRNVAGVLRSTVDTALDLYDSTASWRERAMGGIYHTGRVVRDARSRDRTRF